MSTEKLRFAIVGLDHWYAAFSLADSLKDHPRIGLVGIADASEDRAREVAERVGITDYTTDLTKYINDPSVDAIASLVTVDRNPEIVIAAAEAGKGIVSVKPFANTLEEGTRIVEAVRKAGVVFIPAETRMRQSELNQHIKGLVDGGQLGKIVSGNFTLISSLPQNWPDAQYDGGWWTDPAKVPGGGWIDHAIYQVDRVRWLLGERIVRVTGRTANLVHNHLDVEDYGHAIVETESGAMVAIEDTWSGPAASWRVSSVIIGTDGALSLDTTSPHLTTFGMGGEPGWSTQPLVPDDSELVDPLVDRLTGEGETSYGGVEDAWENLAVCLAFYESARTGRPVDVAQLG
jgi:predicted dehydrogenase